MPSENYVRACRLTTNSSGFIARVTAGGGGADITRPEAEALLDELTAIVADRSDETPAERAHRELHDGTHTYIPPAPGATP